MTAIPMPAKVNGIPASLIGKVGRVGHVRGDQDGRAQRCGVPGVVHAVDRGAQRDQDDDDDLEGGPVVDRQQDQGGHRGADDRPGVMTRPLSTMGWDRRNDPPAAAPGDGTDRESLSHPRRGRPASFTRAKQTRRSFTRRAGQRSR